MKTILNQNLVLRLSINQKPYEEVNGKHIFKENERKSPYIIFDSHRDSPVGFGVKISTTKKTYILQKRIGEKVIKTSLGNVSDFINIDSARKKAKELSEILINTRMNPKKIISESNVQKITLKFAYDEYRNSLLTRPVPAKKNTFKSLDNAFKKLKQWEHMEINKISPREIIGLFDEIAKKYKTTAERTFTWAITLTKHAILMEKHTALSKDRKPQLTENPFLILPEQGKFRTKQQLEQDYKKKRVRKPLSIENLGKWLDAITHFRSKRRTGVDYLLLTTLLGTRRSECVNLKWRDKIDFTEADESSWICLKSRTIFLLDTKNRTDLRLPIADGAFELLSQRHECARNHPVRLQKWVFPAESKLSKTGHYNDAKELVSSLCTYANLEKIGTHDLRRTFGRIAEPLVSYSMIKRLINHSSVSDPTTRYTELDEGRVIEGMQKIELFILKQYPKLYNILLSAKYPLIEENETKTTSNS